MLNKIYVKVKNYIIKNHNSILFLILMVIVLNIKTPYVIEAPGGIISLSDRVTVNNKNLSSNYYTTYVKVIDGKVAGVIASYLFPNWDLIKYKKYSGNTNLSYDELNKVEKLLMNESNNKAIKTAFDKAKVEYEITDNKIIVFYKYDEYKNKLKIGDIINKCDNNSISSVDELHSCINNATDKVTLKVERNKKEIEMDVKVHKQNNGNKIIGVSVINDYKIKSEYDIKITADDSESGSSGGFMTTLSIYSEIKNLKFKNNLKIAGTGTIEDDEKIGEIEGIKYKLLGSEKSKVDIFFVPEDNYKEALKIKRKHKLKMKIIKVSTLDDAINYLEEIKA